MFGWFSSHDRSFALTEHQTAQRGFAVICIQTILHYFTTVYSVRPHFHMRKQSICFSILTASCINFPFWFYSQTLQMGIKHFSGLFVMLCVGFGLSILTTIGEHIVYRLVLPRIKKKSKMKYWLHTSQVRVLEGPCESCVADWESLDKNKVWNVVRALTIGIWRVTAASGAWRGWPKDGMGSTEETV